MSIDFSMYIYCPKSGHYISSTGLTTTPDKNCVWESGFNIEKENSPFKIQQSILPNHCFGIDSNKNPDFNYDCSKYSWLWNKSSKYLTCNKFYLSINNKNELFFDTKPSTTWELICPGTWQEWKTCSGNKCNCKQIKEYVCTSAKGHIWNEPDSQYKTECQGSWSDWDTCKNNKQTRTYTQNPKKCGLGTACEINNNEVQTTSCHSNQIMYYNNDLTLFFSENIPSNVSGYFTRNIYSNISSKFSGKNQIVQVLQVENPKDQVSIRNNDQILITLSGDAPENKYCTIMGETMILGWGKDFSRAARFLIKTIDPTIQEIKKGTPFVLIPITADTKNYSIQYNNIGNYLKIVKNEYDKDTFFTFYDKDGIPPGPSPPGPTPPGPTPPGPSPPGPTPPGPTPPGPTPPGPTPPGPSPSQNHKTIIIVSSSIVAFVILCISLFLVFRKK